MNGAYGNPNLHIAPRSAYVRVRVRNPNGPPEGCVYAI